MAATESSLYLGVDFGTSGARATVIDSTPFPIPSQTVNPFLSDSSLAVYERKVSYKKTPSEEWDITWNRQESPSQKHLGDMRMKVRALDEILLNIPPGVASQIAGVAFDGTSSTTMLVDETSGESLETPQWYNDSQSATAVDFAKVRARSVAKCWIAVVWRRLHLRVIQDAHLPPLCAKSLNGTWKANGKITKARAKGLESCIKQTGSPIFSTVTCF